MGKKPSGIRAAKKLEIRRSTFRWAYKWYVKRTLGLDKKSDPLKGASQGKGIVLEKVQLEAKQPNSGLRKCVRV